MTSGSTLPVQLEAVNKKRGNMPAKDIMRKFEHSQLHSGKGGSVVQDPHQAKAIQMNYARKEGANIPEPAKPAAKKKRGIGHALAEMR